MSIQKLKNQILSLKGWIKIKKRRCVRVAKDVLVQKIKGWGFILNLELNSRIKRA